MSVSARLNLFTIPVQRAFADALAVGLLRQHGGDPLNLARGMVLLPNNRAVTAVRDAFVRLAGGALLLPRLVALGEGDLDAAAGAALDRIDAEPIPPVIDPVQRRLLLAGLLQQEDPDRASSLGEALRLADGLSRALDGLTFEQRTLADLLSLAEQRDGMAQHWAAALHLFTRLSVLWPAELATRGLIDRAEMRNLMLDRTEQLWRIHGLPVPWMVAAGVTTSAPAIARLLKTIAQADGGGVVFPHLDLAMTSEHWALLGPDPATMEEGDPAPLETHAQYHLKLLLDRMDAGRDDVAVWPDTSPHDGPESRTAFISTMLAPARATTDWPKATAAARKLPGVSAIACATPAEEALAIALVLRETLETPGQTAALVTPDRAIASRVIGHLARWGITIDDSAGTPLPQTPPGALVLALARAAGARFAPIDLLALLSHPLVHAHEDERRPWLDRVRSLDLALRGPRPPAGLGGVTNALAALEKRRRTDPLLEEWWAGVAAQLAPLDGIDAVPLAILLERLSGALATLAGDAPWSGAAGRALADLFARLTAHADCAAQPLPLAELAGVLETLMADIAVRPPQGGHPRLFIWGLIEARLQRADRMILAGLNEGQWPQPPSPDPWLAPGIRRSLGLPGLERQIGLASHDFASALGAGEVILTRSVREGSAPTIPSRLMLRIDAFAGAFKPGAGPIDHRAIAAILDSASAEPRGIQPAPSPPLALRPRAISASKLDALLADPFAWYADAILGLSKLEALDGEPTALWRGIMVHRLLETWLKARTEDVDALMARAEARFAMPDVGALLRTLWAPRIMAALRWAGDTIIAGRAEGRVPLIDAVEKRGAVQIGGITLSGKADRIDRLPDGTLAIVDYKTGSSPGKSAVAAGFALQLGLLGAIAGRGGYAEAQGTVSRFEYWRLNRDQKSGSFGWIEEPFYKKAEDGVQADGFVAFALSRLDDALPWLTGNAPFTAKLHPQFAHYADYDQLMRLEEWYGVLGSGEGPA
jgi:ATP-dependent helicase/nuclease subunit B